MRRFCTSFMAVFAVLALLAAPVFPATTDATPFAKKNTAYRLSFQSKATTGIPTALTVPDTEISIDAGNFADATSEATQINSTTAYFVDLTAAEMNGDTIIVRVRDSVLNDQMYVLYPQGATANQAVQADVRAIEGGLTSGNNATLKLKNIQVVNTAGYGIETSSSVAAGFRAASTGGGGAGIDAAGNGSAPGCQMTGGSTGPGFSVTGNGNKAGIQAAGQGTAAGIQITGGATGQGALLTGGVTSGVALQLTTQNNNDDCIGYTPNGTGSFVDARSLSTDPGANPDVLLIMNWLYQRWRNYTIASGTDAFKIKNSAGSTITQIDVTDDGTTLTVTNAGS